MRIRGLRGASAVPSEFIEINLPQPPPPSDSSLHRYTPQPCGDRWALAFNRGERPTMYLCRLPVVRILDGTMYIGHEQVIEFPSDALTFQTEDVAKQWAAALNDPKRHEPPLNDDEVTWLRRASVRLEAIE